MEDACLTSPWDVADPPNSFMPARNCPCVAGLHLLSLDQDDPRLSGHGEEGIPDSLMQGSKYENS